jgi:polyhydroxyalkanoate synthesis regulator phasin
MAAKENKDSEAGVVGRLAGRGEEALTRFVDELGKNPRVTDALARANSAKGKVDSATQSALSGLGLAAADEIKALRKRVDQLERRLAKLEGGKGSSSKSAKRSETKKTPSAASRSKRASESASEEPKVASPAAGRAVGGGVARGGSAGGGTAAR